MKPQPLIYDVAGEGVPLVLVPGGLTGWVSWIPHQERLSASRKVIRVQPIHNELGSAGEPGDPEYDAGVAEESLRLNLDELGLDRVDFAGWSAGGKALIDFTITHFDRVRSLTLVEPAAYWILYQFGRSQPRTHRVHRIPARTSQPNQHRRKPGRVFANAGFVKDPTEARSHPYWERGLPHRMTLSWISDKLMDSRHSVDDLKTITCPVLLTKGTTGEEWATRVVDILGEQLPHTRVIELDGGQSHHIESIDDLLTEFQHHLEQTQSVCWQTSRNVRKSLRPGAVI